MKGTARVALGIAVPLAIFIIIASLTWFFQSKGKRRPLTSQERATLVTAKDLFAMSSQVDLYLATQETGEREDLSDGSATLVAEYQSDEPPMYVVSQVSLEPTESAAKLTYQADSIGGFMALATESKGIVRTDRDDLFKAGDDSKSQLLSIDGKSIGHFIVVRKGKRVFMTIFTGVYDEEAHGLRELITPKLEAMERLP